MLQHASCVLIYDQTLSRSTSSVNCSIIPLVCSFIITVALTHQVEITYYSPNDKNKRIELHNYLQCCKTFKKKYLELQ